MLLHLAFVRSPAGPRPDHRDRHRRGRRRARASSPCYTAADLDLPAHHGLFVLNPELPRPPLATDRVRFVGEAVAVVVAETKAAAVDAVELVEVDYDPLPAVVDPEAALANRARRCSSTAATTSPRASAARAGTPDPLADAEVVVRARMVNQRLAVMPMEGNAIAVLPGGHDGPRRRADDLGLHPDAARLPRPGGADPRPRRRAASA